MVQPLLEPGLERVEQRLVLGDVLLFDHGDLEVQAAGQRVDRDVAGVHVVVHRLLLGGDERHHVQPRAGVDGVLVVVAAQVVVRVTELVRVRAAGHDLGDGAGDRLGLLALRQVEQVGVAVEVVEVLEQPEVVVLLEVRVRFHPGQPRRQVDGDLLVDDRRLERTVGAGQQPVVGLLLHLLGPPAQRQRPLHLRVVGVPGELVAEHDRLDLDPVHHHDPTARVRITALDVDRIDVELAPAPELLVDGDSGLIQRVERHDSSFGRPNSRRFRASW